MTVPPVCKLVCIRFGVGVLDTRKVDRGREGVRGTKKDEEHWLRSCQRILYSLRYYVAFLNPLKTGAPLNNI
jgi:hypothetical protein